MTNLDRDYNLEGYQALLEIAKRHLGKIKFQQKHYHNGTFGAVVKEDGHKKANVSIHVNTKLDEISFECSVDKNSKNYYRYMIAFCFDIRQFLISEKRKNYLKNNGRRMTEPKFLLGVRYKFDMILLELIEQLDQFNNKEYQQLENSLLEQQFNKDMIKTAKQLFLNSCCDPTRAFTLVANCLGTKIDYSTIKYLFEIYNDAEQLTGDCQYFVDLLTELKVEVIGLISEAILRLKGFNKHRLLQQSILFLEKFTNIANADLFFDLAQAIRPAIKSTGTAHQVLSILSEKKVYFKKALGANQYRYYLENILTDYKKVVRAYN